MSKSRKFLMENYIAAIGEITANIDTIEAQEKEIADLKAKLEAKEKKAKKK